MRSFFRGTSLVSLMSYSLDVYTYISLIHEVKTCDDTYSRCILVRPVDLVHPTFPIFPSVGQGPLLPLIVCSIHETAETKTEANAAASSVIVSTILYNRPTTVLGQKDLFGQTVSRHILLNIEVPTLHLPRLHLRLGR